MEKRENIGNGAKFSIIIPVSKADRYLNECIERCQSLDYHDFESILLPDSPLAPSLSSVRVIPTGDNEPSRKRNVGIFHSEGDICAFIDADAYPARDWLKNAAKYFAYPAVVAVGGPNLTPEDDTPMQEASGIILSSLMGSGRFAARYSKKLARNCGEAQSVNLLVRKSVLMDLGGFQEGLWPGEDAKLCFQITEQLKRKITYAPDVVVYHHRRPLFLPHLKQIWSYGLTKAPLVKQFFSLGKLIYFLPTLFVLGFFLGPLLMFLSPLFKVAYFSALGVYFLGAFLTALRSSNLKTGAAVFLGIFLTHVTYGMGFLIGLFREKKLYEGNGNLSSPAPEQGSAATISE